jgi:hypothetical protein
MEALTRLVTESLVRHGFDRPLDYRRLHWSRWFRCESLHSLLFVPSKPGVFALAEEIMDLGPVETHVGTAASVVPPARSAEESREGHDFSRATTAAKDPAALAAGGNARRMLAVTQFFEDDDMAFVLDRMLSRENPMRARLTSGRYFVRFVVIEDQTQRRSICAALNQWMANAAEKATGIGPHFATSLELTPATEYVPAANDAQATLFADFTANREGHDFSRADKAPQSLPALAAEGTAGATSPPSSAERSSIAAAASSLSAPHLDSGAASNIHCPSPLPSGF